MLEDMASNTPSSKITTKRVPLGELNKSDLDSIYNARFANESNAQAVEKRKVKRNMKIVCTPFQKNMIKKYKMEMVETNSTSDESEMHNETCSAVSAKKVSAKKVSAKKVSAEKVSAKKVSAEKDTDANNEQTVLFNKTDVVKVDDGTRDSRGGRELSLRTPRLPIIKSRLTRKSDPQALIYSLEYLEDIITHLLARESELSALPNDSPEYDIAEIDRSVVLNWLAELNEGPQLLEAGVRLFDRCLGRAFTPLGDLNLLGATCIWLAEKLVGVGPPRAASTVSWWCDGAFGPAELLRCERKVLRLLDFPKAPVLAENYLQYILRVSEPERPQVALSIAQNQLTAALYHPRLLALPPSRLAAAAVAAALRVCGHRDWSAFWTCRLCHSVEDIMDLKKELLHFTKVISDSDSSAATGESGSTGPGIAGQSSG